jgi:hypothetical protein
MLPYKVILSSLAVLIALISYIPYFRNIFLGRTKPHAFSWLVWSVLTGIAFAAQVVEKGGAGAWVTGFTAVACFTIFVFALFRGKRRFPLFDWLCLLAAFAGIALWVYTDNPAIAVVIVTLTDALAFAPTFRKGYQKPFEETASTFALSSLKFLIALFALESYSLATWLYPASLVLMNGAFVVMLLIRRKAA